MFWSLARPSWICIKWAFTSACGGESIQGNCLNQNQNENVDFLSYYWWQVVGPCNYKHLADKFLLIKLSTGDGNTCIELFN